MMRLKTSLILCAVVAAAPAFAQQGKQAPANPMWKSGYKWSCKTAWRITCERDGACASDAANSEMSIDYENSRMDIAGESVKIRRHYQQRVADSPLQSEVKIELVDNRVLWLTPVDGSATFSSAWVGALTEPKGGVVLMVSQGAYCIPQK